MVSEQNVLVRKLELFGALLDADKKLLQSITTRPRRLPARSSIIREGESPSNVHLVMEGLVCRSKTMPDGHRQIFAYLLPGDFCDLHVFILRAMDHDIETLSESEVVEIPRSSILDMLSRPLLARALWWATLVDEAVLREWIVNLGQREAEQRIAHLFCEIHLRLKSVGLVSDGKFELPITQQQLAETTGMSAVHMNRSIQSLRSRGLIALKSASVSILNNEELERFCDFDPNYLHLEHGKIDNQQLE